MNNAMPKFQKKLILLIAVFCVVTSNGVSGDIVNLDSMKDTDLDSHIRENSGKIESSLYQLQKSSDRSQTSAFGLDMNEDEVRVVIELMGDVSQSRLDTLETFGSNIETTYQNLVQARVPISQLTAIANLPSVKVVRPSNKPYYDVISEGVGVTGADLAHSFGYTGQGVKVAVIDCGFDITSPEISGNIVENKSFRTDGDITGGNCGHGTATAEIVVDVAPDVQLYLYNLNTDVEWYNAVDYAISKGVDVISFSGGWVNLGNYDGTSPIDQKVDTVRANGILWINSAGNSAKKHWEGTYQDGDVDGWHNFNGTDETNEFWVNGGEMITAFLSWDDWPESDQDYDLLLLVFIDGLPEVLAYSGNPQTGTQPPTEAIVVTVPSDYSGKVHIVIHNWSATRDVDFELYSFDHSFEYIVSSSSLSCPADSSNSLTAGATYWATDVLEDFSSQGPTNDGRTKPDVTAPDGTSSSVYGSFNGTSASAPHVAGAAALLLDQNSYRSPSQLQTLLEANAKDLGTAGKDNQYGSGRINISASLNLPPPTITFVFPTPDNGTILNVNHVYVNITADEVLSLALLEWNGINETMQNSSLNWHLNKTGLADGVYTYKVYGNDTANNWNVSETRIIVPDTTPPQISVHSPIISTNDTTPLLNATFNEFVNFTWYNVDSGTNSSLYGNSQNLTLNLSELLEGYHNVTVYANDSVGNLGYYFANFTVDTEAPYNITLTYPMNNSYINQSSIPLSWSAFDNLSYQLFSNVLLDGVVNASSILTINGSSTNYTVTGLVEGHHNWSITAYDLASNSNSGVVHLFIVDTTSPRVTNLTIYPTKPLEKENVNISVICNDTATEVKALYFNITYPNGLSVLINSTKNGDKYYNDSFNASQFGQYNVQVWANDSAENINSSENKSFAAIRRLSNNTIIQNGSTAVIIDNSLLKLAATSDNQSNSTVNLTVELSVDPSHFGLEEIDATYYQTFKVLNLTNTTDLSNLSRISLNVSYSDEDLTGIVEDSLSMFYWNGSWVLMRDYINKTIQGGPFVFDSGVNTDNDYVWAEVDHFSRYSLGGLKDNDNDSIADIHDNCPLNPNSNQTDTDGDLQGDICDSDDDNDGILDGDDSCPTQAETNNGYQDSDGCPDSKPSIPSGGGGGGGGGSTKGVVIKRIDANSQGTAVFDIKDTGYISEITIYSKRYAYNVKLTAETLKKPFSTMPDPEGLILSYLKLTKSGISESQLEKADVKFQVPVSWLKDNDIAQDSVLLKRNALNAWEDIETEYLNKDADYAYFSAVTSGFSYFVITGDEGSGYIEEKPVKIEIASPPATTPAPTTPAITTPPPTTPAPASKPVLLMPRGNIGIILILLLGISAGAYFLKRKAGSNEK